MYIRRSGYKYKNKKYDNYQLVENIRTAKGPRQKVICSLGDLKPRPKEDWIKLAHKVEEALAGQISMLEEPDEEVKSIVKKVDERKKRKPKENVDNIHIDNGNIVNVIVDQVATEQHREAGSIHVGYQFWRKLGLGRILGRVGLDERSRKLTCAMVMNRLIYPKSEHAMPDWINTTALGDILGEDFGDLADDSLYRNMGRLYPRREQIERALCEAERDLFNLDQTVFLYDLTSTYFEGAANANPKARRGYSRDKRPDCKQVVVGLVVNRDGFPQAHEVFEGNRHDSTTVKDMLDVLNRRVEIVEGRTVVVDRGMSGEENLLEIKRRGLHYVVASRQSERDEWLGEFEDADGFEEVIRETSPLNPFQKKPGIWVKIKHTNEGSLTLCVSEGRKEKDKAIRQKHEARMVADLEKLSKRVGNGRLKNETKIWEAIGRLKERYPRVGRYYDIYYNANANKFSYEVDAAKMSKAEKLDGSYLLKSDRRDLSADEAWRIYTLLTRAEDAFRDMKSPLAERPIFHHLDRQVDTHIFLCVLAYHLLVAIEKTLLDRGIHTSWGTIRDALKTHQVCTVLLPTSSGNTLKIRKSSVPEPHQKEIYDLLGIPREIIKPVKTWVKNEK